MKGKLTISRISSNQPDDKDVIRIRLEDELSSIEFLEIRMTPEAFALALTGLAAQECSFELVGIQNVGKVLQTKAVVVPVSEPADGWGWTTEERQSFVEPFEVDGWKAYNIENIGNRHKMVEGQSAYYVTFMRFVEA